MSEAARIASVFGYSNRSFPKELDGKYAGQKCLVVASAKCVWDDVARAGCIGGDHNQGWHVMCINDIAMHWPGPVNHLYSNQHHWLPHWVNARRETINGIKVREKWGPVGATHSNLTGGQYQWPWPGAGTSTLNGVYTALAMGYNPVVICGAPLDNSPHYFEPDWCYTNFAREVGETDNGQMMYWSNAKQKIFNGRVKSMSGRTRDLLGEYQ